MEQGELHCLHSRLGHYCIHCFIEHGRHFDKEVKFRDDGSDTVGVHARHTAFDGSAIKLPSVQQQVDKYDKQVKGEKTKDRLRQAIRSTK